MSMKLVRLSEISCLFSSTSLVLAMTCRAYVLSLHGCTCPPPVRQVVPPSGLAKFFRRWAPRPGKEEEVMFFSDATVDIFDALTLRGQYGSLLPTSHKLLESTGCYIVGVLVSFF